MCNSLNLVHLLQGVHLHRIVLLLRLRWRTQTDINVTGTLDSHHMMPPAARVSARVFGTRARPIPPGGQANLLPFMGLYIYTARLLYNYYSLVTPFHYPSTVQPLASQKTQ